eukprot:gnl/Trimastix_PCT/2553.p1 GENE.gnl/Trimastix_PCT/2553~~gnl/Trimastix_PCT/2553.p1  ORF type:complete len:151 (-),score=34.47 gnl/Trimastix_PCT/2553:112-564(-)
MKPAERKGRRKITIEYIKDKARRHITFSKRKAGIMKKAYELSTLTGTELLLLVASETGHVYTFATQKLRPIISKSEGKELIQVCLSADGTEEAGQGDDATQTTTTTAPSTPTLPQAPEAPEGASAFPPPTGMYLEGTEDPGEGETSHLSE